MLSLYYFTFETKSVTSAEDFVTNVTEESDQNTLRKQEDLF